MSAKNTIKAIPLPDSSVIGIMKGHSEYITMWLCSVVACYSLFSFYLSILKIAEVARYSREYCKGDALEIDTARYRVLAAFKDIEGKLKSKLVVAFLSVAITAFFLVFYILQAAEGLPEIGREFALIICGATFLVSLAVFIYCSVRFGITPDTNIMKSAYLLGIFGSGRYVVGMIIAFALIYFKVMHYSKIQLIKNPGSKLNRFQVIGFGLIFVANWFLIGYIPLLIDRMRPAMTEYEATLATIKTLLREMAFVSKVNSRTVCDIRRLPSPFWKALVTNYLFYYPGATQNDAIAALSAMLENDDPTSNPIAFLSTDKYETIRMVSSAPTMDGLNLIKPGSVSQGETLESMCSTCASLNAKMPVSENLELLRKNLIYCNLLKLQPSSYITPSQGDSVTFFRKMLLPMVFMIVLYTLLHFVLIYEKFRVSAITPLLAVCAILIFIIFDRLVAGTD